MKLNAVARKAIPASKFGLPGSRKFPMPDKSHAANAKARATQGVKAGTLSASAATRIRAKANKMLGSSAGAAY
jgi:outer membrane lipoprotein SlyB